MNINRAKQLKITAPDMKPAYGGDQGWFSSNTRAQGGCSSIAGANALRALCRTSLRFRREVSTNKKIPRELKDAIMSKEPSKDSFEMLMTGIYNTMGTMVLFPLNLIYDRLPRNTKFFKKVPSTFGQTNAGLIIGIIRFARQFGLNLSVKSLPAAFLTQEKAIDFIEEGLKVSGAVILLTSFNKHNARLYNAASNLESHLNNGWDAAIKCHFTTITDIDETRLLITTWGKPAVIDFDELAGSWQSIKAFQSTLMYLVPSTKAEATRCMLAAWKVFGACIIHSIIRR